MNNLKELIRIAKHRQKLTDAAIEKAINELRMICSDKHTFEEAEEAILLFIYEGTDIDDKKITLDELMRSIKKERS